MTIQAGQIYRSCDPRGGPRIRVKSYTPGHNTAHVVDADDDKRPRWILVDSLHASATTRYGKPRRTGYALEAGQ